MFKEIRQAMLFTIATMVLLRWRVSRRPWGIGPAGFADQAHGSLIRRDGRHDRRFTADRAEFDSARVLPFPAIGRGLQRRHDRRQ